MINPDIDFDTKVEMAVERYFHRKHIDSASRRNSNNDLIVDKYVEKEKLLLSISSLIQQIARVTGNELLDPIKQHIEQIEHEMHHIKELMIKSLSNTGLLQGINQGQSAIPILDNSQMESSEELSKFKKKLQNHKNLINLLMENQTQMKQNLLNNNSIEQKDDVTQIKSIENLFENFKKEVSDMIIEGNRQIKGNFLKEIQEKSNACWVVLGDLNNRIEKMETEKNEQQKTPEKKGFFKKAQSLLHN